ncbi:hypothetical protein BDZ89DRAFT_1133551 [Hymenopellis radicata]|nr:hypothetical protein BDZ89DRAFT_1133551 [Hymenopellis radicata]
MSEKRKPKQIPDPDEDDDDAPADEPLSDGDDVDEDDIKTLTKGWVSTFQKKWLDGAALAYAQEHHLDEFCRKNAESAREGTAYAHEASNDMMRTFGYDGRAYDDVDDLVSSEKKSGDSKKSAATDEPTESDKGASSAGKTEPTIQAREAELLKAAHITRFRNSFTAWLRYQYKDRGGDTLRGRGKSKVSGRPRTKKKSKHRSYDAEGEDLSRLLIHELLGLGQSKFHVPHAFQLWAKDQPSKFRKRFLKKKFHECDDDEKEIYRVKVKELKEEAREKQDALRESFNTRLDPQDAAKLLEAMPYILDPLLTSLSAMLHAKLSLLIGVPEPTQGGVVTIKSFDKGDNHEDVPATFGQTAHYARHVDAFKEFLNDAYTQDELRAKGSASAQRSDGKKVVIIVQNMALPPGENWITRKDTLENEEDDDEELTPIQFRRLRREKREAKAQEMEEHGPPAKRPRGRPRKQKVQDEDSEEDNDGPRQAKKKKTMPEPKQPRRSKKATAATTTASGSTTLGDITTSRGKQKPAPKIAENRRKLLALAASVVASSEEPSAPPARGRASRKRPRSPSISPERTPEPSAPPARGRAGRKPPARGRASRKRPHSPSISPERTPSPSPTHPRPKPRPLPKKQVVVAIPPPNRPKPHPAIINDRLLTPVPEADETRDQDLGPQMDQTDVGGFTNAGGVDRDFVIDDTGFDLGVDEFEVEVPRIDDEDGIDDIFKSPPNKRRRTTPDEDEPNTTPTPAFPAKTRPKARVPPMGDHRLRKALPAGKPPSTRAASVAFACP